MTAVLADLRQLARSLPAFAAFQFHFFPSRHSPGLVLSGAGFPFPIYPHAARIEESRIATDEIQQTGLRKYGRICFESIIPVSQEAGTAWSISWW
jgi:hypothetical protein